MEISYLGNVQEYWVDLLGRMIIMLVVDKKRLSPMKLLRPTGYIGLLLIGMLASALIPSSGMSKEGSEKYVLAVRPHNAPKHDSGDDLPGMLDSVKIDWPPKVLDTAMPDIMLWPDSIPWANSRWSKYMDSALFRILVDSNGRVRRVRILKSTGRMAWDSLFIKKARDLRCQPAQYEGRPVAAWLDWSVFSPTFNSFRTVPAISIVALRVPKEIVNDSFDRRMTVRVAFDSAAGFHPVQITSSRGLDEHAVRIAKEAISKLSFMPPANYDYGDSASLYHLCELVPSDTVPQDFFWLPHQPSPDSLLDTLQRPPEFLSYTSPIYPIEAQIPNVKRVVWVSALIDSCGSVCIATVAKSSGIPVVDYVAVRAAMKNRFLPSTVVAQPVPSWVIYRVEFAVD